MANNSFRHQFNKKVLAFYALMIKKCDILLMIKHHLFCLLQVKNQHSIDPNVGIKSFYFIQDNYLHVLVSPRWGSTSGLAPSPYLFSTHEGGLTLPNKAVRSGRFLAVFVPQLACLLTGTVYLLEDSLWWKFLKMFYLPKHV